MTTDNSEMMETGVFRRGSVYWWKIKAPADLRHLYPTQWAERISLGTKVLREANRLAARKRSDWLEAFERQRAGKHHLDHLTPELGKQFATKTLRDVLTDDVIRDPDARRDLALYHTHLGMVSMQCAAEDLGMQFSKDVPGAVVALAHYRQAVRKGLLASLPERPALEAARPRPTLMPQVLERWINAHGNGKAKDTIAGYGRAVRAYEDCFGAKPVTELVREDGYTFRNHLLKQKLASKTQHERMGNVKTLLKFAHQDLEVIPSPLWTGISIDYKTENPRPAWTIEQLNALLALPLFSRYELPSREQAKRAGEDAAYWIPILGLFTGARIGELCQLRVADIKEVDGIPVIDFNREDGKRLKSEASARQTPVHSQLVQLGFLDYVRSRVAANDRLLWPALPVNPDRPSHGFSLWFNQHLLPKAGTSLPDFHSLRHTVESRLSMAEVSAADRDDLIGHEIKGSTGTRIYRHVTLPYLKAVIEKLHYDGIRFVRAYPQARHILEPSRV